VLATAVSDYRDRDKVLPGAVKDGHALEAFWKDRLGRFGKQSQVLALVNGDVTRQKIKDRAREVLKETRPDDLVVLSFAGHGIIDDKGEYRFATVDNDFLDRNWGTALTFSDIEGLLGGVRARRKLVLLDTCHSGEKDPGDIAEYLDYFADLRRSTGAVVLAAVRGDYKAQEGATVDRKPLSGGLFTHFVLQGLRDGKADVDRDGHVSVSELRDYVIAEIRKRVEKKELDEALIPALRRDNFEFDFRLD
jgi:hypothetical protein